MGYNALGRLLPTKRYGQDENGVYYNHTKEFRAAEQRRWRQYMAKKGYKRLDIYLPPETFEKLKPHLDKDYGSCGTHYGAALVNLLDDIEWE